MAKSDKALPIEAQKQGKPCTYTIDEGGCLASMRRAV